ncbi:MAG: hypothetical protein WC882_05095 [Candidatus Gracilibacteria bacterium]
MIPKPGESFNEEEPVWEDDDEATPTKEITQISIQDIPILDTNDSLLKAFPEPYYREAIFQAIRARSPHGTRNIQIFTTEIKNTPNTQRHYRVQALYLNIKGNAIGSTLHIGDYGIRR